MINIIFRLMIIFPLFQTWLSWNGIGIIDMVEHAFYVGFTSVIFFKVVWNDVVPDKRTRLLLTLFYVFILVGLVMTGIQLFIHNHASFKGIGWELYKLVRNLSVFFFAYYFQSKDSFIKNIKLYIGASSVMSVISFFQYLYGIKVYELLRLTPTFESYPDFYLVYLRDNRSMGLMEHPTTFGVFVAISFFILIYSSALKEKLYKRASTQYFLLLLSLVGVFASGARSVFLLALAIPIFMSVFQNIKRLRRIYFILLVMTSPVLFFAIRLLLFKLWQYSYYTGNETEFRVLLWQQAKKIVMDNYLIGSGLGTWGDFSASYATYAPYGAVVPMSDSYLSHILVEHGANIVTVFIIFCISAYFFWQKSHRSNESFTRLINIVAFTLLIFTAFESIKSMQLSMFENTFIIFYIWGFVMKTNSQVNQTI